jgi:Mg-chelatase subunit ChlD
VTDGVYSIVAYVENPNISSEASDVPYSFKLYDENNSLIMERTGSTFIPRNKSFAVFEGKIPVNGRIPKSVQFSFTAKPIWKKSLIPNPEIQVTNKALLRPETSPRIEANLLNKSLEDVTHIEATAIVYDGNNNAVAVSRTFVDSIPKGQSIQAVFTWPQPFATRLDVCEVPDDVMLVLDRSGSMKDIIDSSQQSKLDGAKSAAISFVNNLKSGDQAGLISFATKPSDPIDFELTTSHAKVIQQLQDLAIKPLPDQNTDLGDGLLSAFNEMSSQHRSPGSTGVIIALTDGIATDPIKAGDANYPSEYASDAAAKIRQAGLQLYTIGLGKDVNASFLQSIATDKDHYFSAPTNAELKTIYDTIATQICVKRPAIIEIITRVLPQ